MIRTFLALVAGFVTAMLGVLAFTALSVFVFYSGDLNAEPTAPYLAFNVAYSFAFAVAGGWVAARIAHERPILHGFLLAAVMISLAIPSAIEGGPQPGQPMWYPWALVLIVGIGAPLGALIRAWSAPKQDRLAPPA
jgi:putative membrane protein (TIGR04086 family)